MHRLRLIVILLVVLALLVGAGFAGQATLRAHRLAEQKAVYATGLEASRRADCARALPLLTSARTGGSATVRAAADRERQTCDDLIQAQKWAVDQPPAAALSVWIRYLISQPPAPYQATAREAARTQLTSGPLNTTVTPALCWQRSALADNGIMPYHDPLAQKFLSACVTVLAKNNAGTALQMLGILGKEFPTADLNQETVVALGRMIATRLTLEGIHQGAQMQSYRSRSHNGRTQLVLVNTQRNVLQIILAGDSTRLVKLPACTSCSGKRNDAELSKQCDRKGTRTTITLPAGRYNYAALDSTTLDQRSWVERWNLKPNADYWTCWWP